MKNVIEEKSFAFAVRIVNLYKCLTSEQKEFVMSKQLLRSGTSIGANVSEAQRAQSKADFVSKFNISLKEANETDYWLRLIFETEYIDRNQYESLIADLDEVIRILVSICNTTKSKMS